MLKQVTTQRVNAAALVRKAFPFSNLFVAEKAVSLYLKIHKVPDCHLVRTLIPVESYK